MTFIDQVVASFSRSMRIFLRDKAIFGSSLFVPIFFLLVLPQVMFSNTPADVLPLAKGFLTIALVVLLIMTTGMSNLSGSIAGDRDHDLYSKLSSMPINPWAESIGRILTVIAFSSLGSLIILTLGVVTGAELPVAPSNLVFVLGIGLVIMLAVSGAGFIISSFAQSESAASHIGVAIVLANYFIGITVPYKDLPELLKGVARYNPISAGTNMMTTLVLGQDVVGYNPLNFFDVGLMITLCGIILVVGLLLYSRRSWRGN